MRATGSACADPSPTFEGVRFAATRARDFTINPRAVDRRPVLAVELTCARPVSLPPRRRLGRGGGVGALCGRRAPRAPPPPGSRSKCSPPGGRGDPSGTIAERVRCAGAISVRMCDRRGREGARCWPIPLRRSTCSRRTSRRASWSMRSRHMSERISGVPTRYDVIELDLDGHTEFHRRLVDALRRVPWGEVVTYGEARRARRAPGSCPRGLGMCARQPVRAGRSVSPRIAADGIGGYGLRASSRKRRSWRPRVSSCDQNRASDRRGRARRLAAIDPTRGCDRLAELSALFHAGGVVHLLGRGEARGSPRCLSGRSPAAPSRCCVSSGSTRAADVHGTPSIRQLRYQVHVAGSEVALAVLTDAGILDGQRRPLAAPPRHVVGRRCCRGAYLRGAFLAGIRGRPPGRRIWRRAASREAPSRCSGSRRPNEQNLDRRAAGSRGRLREGLGIDRGDPGSGRGDRRGARPRERRRRRRGSRRANRLANADHANVVRMTRAAQEQLAAAKRLRADGASTTCPTACAKLLCSVSATRPL